ncbi:MAG: exosortase/archaeosortase family protein [Gaiellaceae bacterium]
MHPLTSIALRREPAVPRVLPVSVRIVVVSAAFAIGYRYSLGTLVSEWNHDTPLADLALVPAVALALAAAAARRHRYVGHLRLGRCDYVLAIPLLLSAIVLVTVGPIEWSKYFWAARIDLLTLPLVALASVVLLFGARVVFPFALPVVFLLLAWPLPYAVMLEHELARFTAATTATVSAIASSLAIATPDARAGAGVFVVRHGGHAFSVGIGDACSGVNSLVGFLIVAAAGLYFVRGRFTPKLAWFFCGALLVYVFNVARILGILVVGRAFGERAAFEVVHPVAGLVALTVAVALAMRLLPWFRLQLRAPGEQSVADTPVARPAPLDEQATIRRAAPRIALVAGATIALALAGGNLAVAARGLDNFGRPAIKTFAADPTVGPRWRVGRVEDIGWATPYFGSHSSWVRYRLRPRSAGADAFTIWLDAITSRDLGALNAYTLAHCYAFHGFRVQLARRVDLGDGVIGQEFAYRTARTTWHAVAWQWPVLGASGRVEHERMALIASSSRRPTSDSVAGSAALAAPVLALQNSTAPSRDDNQRLTQALVAVASAAVAARVAS